MPTSDPIKVPNVLTDLILLLFLGSLDLHSKQIIGVSQKLNDTLLTTVRKSIQAIILARN